MKVMAPVWVQISLADVTGVVVASETKLRGQLVAVRLDSLPEAFAKLREPGLVDAMDEVVYLFPDEVTAI